MKRKFMSLVLALLVACSLFSLTACNGNKDNQTTTAPQKPMMTLVVGSKSPFIYEIGLENIETDKGLMPVFEYLNKEKGLKYECTQVGGNTTFTKIGELVQRDNTYIYFFSTVEKDRDTTENSRFVKFEGKIIYSTALDVSKMTIEPGCIIYIGTLQR